MKRKHLWVGLLILFLFSCKKDNDREKKENPVNNKLELSYQTISFSADKDASLVVVNTGGTWEAICDAGWIDLSAYTGDTATGIIVGASANMFFSREATITFTTSKESKELKVKQAGVPFIEFKVSGVAFKFLPVEADTSFYLEGTSYFDMRSVYLSSFYISETEVTNAQWSAITGSLPYEGENNLPDLPVVVNWNDITNTFLPAANQLTDYKLRLPTECEWEVAAEGGRENENTSYAGSIYIDEVAWHYRNSGGKKHAVGLKKPNELGLYDMSGNVSEWCSDWYVQWTEQNPPPDNETNPTGPSTGTLKVIRGGDFLADRFEYDRNSCNISSRNYLPPGIDTQDFLYEGFTHYTGFRLVIAKE